MEIALRRLLLLMLLSSCAVSAATITFNVIDLGPSPPGQLVRIDYSVAGLSLQTDEELDIRFDPSIFVSLSDATAGPGLDPALFQPNNPPGAFGDLSLLATFDNPSLSGISVRAVRVAPVPTTQPFTVNAFDAQGRFLRTIESGVATLSASNDTTVVPEPSSLLLIGLIVGVETVRRLRQH